MDWTTLLPVAGTALVTGASLFTSLTKTPAPNTTWGKIYRVIDWAAINVGKAKDKGLIPTDPRADKVAAGVVDVAKGMLGVGLLCAVVGVSACSSVHLPSLPTPATADTDRIEARIVAACTADGVMRPIVKAGVTIAVPVGSVPLAAVEAGIDKVCANPAKYATAIGTAEWVAKNIADIVKAQRAPAGG